MEITKEKIFFDPALQAEIKDRFYYVNEDYLGRKDASAKNLATLLVDRCNALYEDKPGDDTSCAVVRIRERKQVNIMFGPPSKPRDDEKACSLFFGLEGKHIVCGGVTATVAARYLGKEILPDNVNMDETIPPMSIIDGVDLVTEGLITLRRVLEYAEDYLGRNSRYFDWSCSLDGASLIACALFEEATDIIICDKLTDPHSAGSLTEAVASYMDLTKRHNPNVYLAFRGADLLLGSYAPFSDRSQAPQLARRPSLRNTLYSDVVSLLAPLLRTSQPAPEGLYLPDEWRRHILQSTGTGIGNAFWHLLNASVSHNWLGRQFHQLRGTKSVFELSSAPDSYLPPHVYLTSTPIDSHLRIYTSDPDDVTRFYCTEGSHIQSFTQTIRQGNSQHLCFGSYQLLTDVLLQNGLYPSGLRNRPPLLKYAQSKL